MFYPFLLLFISTSLALYLDNLFSFMQGRLISHFTLYVSPHVSGREATSTAL